MQSIVSGQHFMRVTVYRIKLKLPLEEVIKFRIQLYKIWKAVLVLISGILF